MPPVDLFYWGVAAVPLVLLLITLVVFRWRAHEAASVGMFAALFVAVGVYETSIQDLTIASARGVWDAVFILYVIIPALIFYHVIDRANGFDALRERIKSITTNELFLVLAFGWIFVSFMQSISGFGTPIVVVAPLLLALGVKAVYAVAIPLIGHAWANTFGTLGVAWIALETTAAPDNVILTALGAGVLLWIANLVGGVTVAWIYGRREAVTYALPLIVAVSLIHGGGQLIGIVLWEPAFANFFAASIALLSLAPLAMYTTFATETDAITTRPAMATEPENRSDTGPAAADGGVTESAVSDDIPPAEYMSLKLAALPFATLAVVAFATATINPLGDALAMFEAGPAFPETKTGFGVVTEAADPYEPFAPLSHPGTFLLISTVVAYVAYRHYGYYDTDTLAEDDRSLTWAVLGTAIPASVAVISFLVMALIMDNTGQTQVLAEGMAEVATPNTYGFLSPLIGALGAFMTSSNTASNILFSGLQQETSLALGGIDTEWVLGGQTAGGAIGNAMAPANVILGTTAVGIVGREGDVLRKTIPWVAGVALLMGVAIIIFNAIELLGVF